MVARRKICVVTGTRAEFGLLSHLVNAIQTSPDLSLQLIATGMHLSPEFGMTYQEIEAQGYRIDRKIEMLVSSDTPVGIAKSTALCMTSMSEAISQLSPNIIVLLGDRFEAFATAAAALFARVPVAHIHGGEATEGLIDEAIRHSITKMSYLHFVAAEDYRNRVIQLGECPSRVFLVGGLGVDGLTRTRLLPKRTLERELNFEFGPRNLLICMHPVTLEQTSAASQFDELLDALEMLPSSFKFIFTKGNADTDGRAINAKIDRFSEKHGPRVTSSFSLGQLNFWSALSICDAIIGNSSSGLLEAPSLKTPTVNIGDRQKGRLMANSVVNCEPTTKSIFNAIQEVLSSSFLARVEQTKSPYGGGGATERIIEILRSIELTPESLKKTFYNLKTQ